MNTELPTAAEMRRLAPQKTHDTIEAGMHTIHDRLDAAEADRRVRRKVSTVARTAPPPFAPAGQSTQMIVGAGEANDRDVITTAARLYDRHGLRRVYYSAFSPFPLADRRLPITPPSLVREHRLYQTDWLLRFYGFAPGEIVTGTDGNLPLDLDPKLAWALAHRDFFPVDVNRAPREALLRVPGLGARTVKALIATRRHHRLSLADLEALRVPVRRARPFVITADSHPAPAQLDGPRLFDALGLERQLNLFEVQA
jgi:predicted DNA-binding helix-hairpin-helix protein